MALGGIAFCAGGGGATAGGGMKGAAATAAVEVEGLTPACRYFGNDGLTADGATAGGAMRGDPELVDGERLTSPGVIGAGNAGGVISCCDVAAAGIGGMSCSPAPI
jgi:hypothetical protein